MSAEQHITSGAAPGEQTVEGPPRPFFRSRWVPAPGHVRELGAGAGLPGGFRAAGVVCGIKPSGNPDLGMLLGLIPQTTPAPSSRTWPGAGTQRE